MIPPTTAASPTPAITTAARPVARAKTGWLIWGVLFLVFLMASAGVAGAFFVWQEVRNTSQLQHTLNDTQEKQLATLQQQIKTSQDAN